MNGIGPDTVIKAKTPAVLVLCRVLAVVFSLAFAAVLAMWIYKYTLFRKTEAYLDYRKLVAKGAEEKKQNEE